MLNVGEMKVKNHLLHCPGFRYLIFLQMAFSKKIWLLFAGCLVVWLILCFIQYRLVRNSFRLEERVYIRQIEEKLKEPEYLSDSLDHKVMAELLLYLKNELSSGRRPDLSQFQQRAAKVTVSENIALKSLPGDCCIMEGISHTLQYPQIILYSQEKADTLLSRKSNPLLLTTALQNGSSKKIELGEELKKFSFNIHKNNIGNETPYRLEVIMQSLVYAKHWDRNIYKRMILTIIDSSVLILAVLTLFFLVFRALLKQKKIADITTSFANNMTHELKTPLASAGVAVKSLRTPEARLDEEWHNELLDQLNDQHNKIRRIMDSVLNSAMDKPWGMPQIKRTSLKVIVDDAEHMVINAGRPFSRTGSDQISIDTDPDLLLGILANLIDNAIKYTQPHTPVNIHYGITSDQFFIAVEDSGKAIPSKYQKYLFQKFFRVPREDGRHIRGLGLGLYLCRMQVTELGGNISYRVNKKGGNTFTIHLPYGKNQTAFS